MQHACSGRRRFTKVIEGELGGQLFRAQVRVPESLAPGCLSILCAHACAQMRARNRLRPFCCACPHCCVRTHSCFQCAVSLPLAVLFCMRCTCPCKLQFALHTEKKCHNHLHPRTRARTRARTDVLTHPPCACSSFSTMLIRRSRSFRQRRAASPLPTTAQLLRSCPRLLHCTVDYLLNDCWLTAD